MRGRLAVALLVASMVPALLGCEPAPVPSGFDVTPVGSSLQSSEQHVLVRASDGALWTAGAAGGLDRFDPGTGAHTSTILADVAMVFDLLPGPDGSVMAAVFSTDGDGNSIDGRVLRVETDLSVDTMVELGPDGIPGGLAHDGFTGFWVSDGTGDRILRVPFAGGAVDEFDVPDGVMPSALLATEPDTVWFVPGGSLGLGRLDVVTGTVEVGPLDPGIGSAAFSLSLIVGPDGNLWYTRLGTHGMFRFDPDTNITDEIDGAELWPRELAVGADGGVYATLMCGIDHGLMRVDPATLAVTTFDVGVSSARGTALGSLVRDGTGFWAVGYPSSGFHHLAPAAAAAT